MKKVLLLVVGCWLIVGGARAQWVSIPDSNFVGFLQGNFPSCMNGNQMDTTCAEVVNAVWANCSYRFIQDLTGIQYLDSLRELDCSNNQLIFLPPLPAGLAILNCNHNQLTALPALPGNLTTLECDNNQLSALPVLPDSLNYLTCDNNQLTSLPALPGNLTSLECDSNQLASLPTLPGNLINLVCDSNQLTSLPVLPNSVVRLFCANNQLTGLGTLPGNLTTLECDNNQLTSLLALPGNLTTLLCDRNQLTSLPVLPNGLINLYCAHNQLTSLPALPNSITSLGCSFNQLSALPALPDYFWELTITGNSDIACLPWLGRIVNLNFSSTAVICVPNYGSVDNSIPDLHALPLCDSLTPNPCDTTISNIHNPFTGTRDDFRLSPNPATNTVTISIDEAMIGGTATLSDMAGRKMAAAGFNSQYLSFNTSDFANGVYFVTVMNKQGKAATKKIVISR